jgi:N-carbamoyl-L-amino-acid hydrolase
VSFADLWESLLPAGRDPATGGYRRFSWTSADAECRAWFSRAAEQLGLRPATDRNGNLWAWWDPPAAGDAGAPSAPASPAVAAGGPPAQASAAGGHGAPLPRAGSAGAAGEPSPRAGTGAIVAGSHLDSVPDGGAFDGPLGIVSAFAAIELLRERGLVPARPVAVAAFTEEEGARFGVACLGSRLATGAIDPEHARGLRDAAGVTLAEAMAAAGCDPGQLGPDEHLIAGLGAYLELHIEQGRGLADLRAAVGLGTGIWPHGRWRLEFTGRADHAGTATLPRRRDPMLPFAATVLASRHAAAAHGALATIGRVIAEPGAVNAVSSMVTAWLDARAPDEAALQATVDQILSAAAEAGRPHAVSVSVRHESATGPVEFDRGLRARLTSVLAAQGISAPVLATGAGHDAGVLAARLPTAMLFVRNPSGVSHAPAEHADRADCLAGTQALAAVLEELAFR